MLQIAIWGIAAMLVVKALDVLHQQSISRASEKPGSENISNAAAAIAVLSAFVLVLLANNQAGGVKASALGTVSGNGPTYDSNPNPALSEEEATKAAEDAVAAASAAAADATAAASEAAEAASKAAADFEQNR